MKIINGDKEIICSHCGAKYTFDKISDHNDIEEDMSYWCGECEEEIQIQTQITVNVLGYWEEEPTKFISIKKKLSKEEICNKIAELEDLTPTGRTYIHIKTKGRYNVVAYALNCETESFDVVYRDVCDAYKVFTRPVEEFIKKFRKV